MKHKIIVIALVIATITAAFCISTNAINYPETLVLNENTVLVWNNEIINEENETFVLPIKIRVWNHQGDGNRTYNEIRITRSSQNVYTITYYTSSTVQVGIYNINGSNAGWQYGYENHRDITVIEEITITDTEVIKFLYDNVSGLPNQPSPHAQELSEMLDDSKSFLSTSLSAATLIITWLAANQICLCAMYLFILVSMVGVCKRFVKGS